MMSRTAGSKLQDDIAKMLKDKVRPSTIARRLGCSRTMVYNVKRSQVCTLPDYQLDQWNIWHSDPEYQAKLGLVEIGKRCLLAEAIMGAQ